MATLRSIFGELGLSDVETCLASGNVLFSVTRAGDRSKLEDRIARGLESHLGYKVETYVRTADEVRHVVEARLFSERDLSAPHSLHVLFLRDPLDPAIACKLEACRTDVDAFKVDGREIHWRAPVRMSESEVWDSPDVKALRLPAGTMRKLTTVAKIAGMLQP